MDIVVENVGDPDYKSKLKVMLGADNAPDIFFSWSGEFAYKFARAGSALDLMEYYEADPEWKDSFIQAALEPFQYEEGIYGVPVRVDAKLMIYNKDLFEKYNVEVPTTYDEFLNVCQTFKDAGITPLAMGNSDPWTACHYISTFNSMCVPSDVRAVDNNYKTGTFTDEGYVQALNMLKDLNDKGYFTENTNSIDFEVARNDFLTGNAAMTYMQSIEFRRCAENNLNAGAFKIPFPEGEDGDPELVTGSPDGFMISKSCKNPEIAIEFLKLMTSKPWQERMITQLSSPASVQGIHNEENSDALTLQAVDIYSKASGFANWLDADIHSKIADVYDTWAARGNHWQSTTILHAVKQLVTFLHNGQVSREIGIEYFVKGPVCAEQQPSYRLQLRRAPCQILHRLLHGQPERSEQQQILSLLSIASQTRLVSSFSYSAPTGHTATHCPQYTQGDSLSGFSNAVVILKSVERPL